MLDIKKYIRNYKRIFVIANSNSESFLTKIQIHDDDVFIIFNKGIEKNNLKLLPNIIWLHRFSESENNYFGESNTITKKENIIHGTISDSNNKIPTWSDIHINWKIIQNFDEYPIGKKIFNFKSRKKNRKIISPTTGFITLIYLDKILDHSQQKLLAIGFAQLPNGWHGHDWNFERKFLSRQRTINLFTPAMKKDFLIHFRKYFPNSFF